MARDRESEEAELRAGHEDHSAQDRAAAWPHKEVQVAGETGEAGECFEEVQPAHPCRDFEVASVYWLNCRTGRFPREYRKVFIVVVRLSCKFRQPDTIPRIFR